MRADTWRDRSRPRNQNGVRNPEKHRRKERRGMDSFSPARNEVTWVRVGKSKSEETG